MSTEATAEIGRPGRPRSEKARHAILRATADLLLSRGLAGVSMDAVAERAGVSKATIYRWWPTKEALALDTLYEESQRGRPERLPDTGTLRGDLLALLQPWARLVTSRPYGRLIAALVTRAQVDTGFGDQYRARFVEPRREEARVLLRRGIDRGELPADVKLEVGLDLLYGPLYHRLLHGHAPLDEDFVRDVVDTALAGLAGPAGPGDRR